MPKKKTRGKLYPSDREIEYYRKRFVEGAQLEGRTGLLHQVKSFKQVNTDTYYTYESPVQVSYYLTQNPKKSILLKLGWYSENSDNVPILCYLNFYDDSGNPINPSEGAIVEISSRRLPHQSLSDVQTIKFSIVNVSTDFDMNMFICNLVPYRNKEKPAQPLPTSADPTNENRWFDIKLLGEDDLIGPNQL